MEGDGSGMVAIVQGLQNAGLAVTLTNRALLHDSLKPLLPCRSSIQTSTNEVYSRSTAVEARDGHYFSSYQLAHCNIRPTSPPQRLSEFPPQRPELIPKYGNFEVGGRGSAEYGSLALSHSQTRRPRTSTSWLDRSRGSPPRDPFAESLRRYPDPSLDGTVSTELLQRLISYTQNKHLSKHSHTRSLRSLRGESPTNERTDRQTKNIQTYTRTKAVSRDNGANTSNDIKFNFAKKDRSFSPTPSPYNFAKRFDTGPSSYDYLKASAGQARRTEVRYLSDVKRCVRDTLKQILNDDPLVCPQIKSRLSRHRREHHKICENSCPGEDCPGKASVATSFEDPLRQRLPHIATPNCPGVCCHCEKPFPCNCEPGSYKENSLKLPNDQIVYDLTDDKDSKIKEEIIEWLKDLPVFADDSDENKAKRETMINNLAETLKNFEGIANYESNVKDEIKNCLDNLPIWYPGFKREQESFNNKIADDLFKKLAILDAVGDIKDTVLNWINNVQFNDEKVDINRIIDNLVKRVKPLVDKPDDMKLEIKDMLEKLPIVNKNKVINKLAENLATDLFNVAAQKLRANKRTSIDSEDENLESIIIEWLEERPDVLSDINSNKAKIENLVKKLKKTNEQSIDDTATQRQMKEEVRDWINLILNSKVEKMETKNINILLNELVDSLVSALKVGKEEMDILERKILAWVENVPELAGTKNNGKMLQLLAKTLKKAKKQTLDTDKIREKMNEDITNWMDLALKSPKAKLDSKTKNELSNKLLDTLVDILKDERDESIIKQQVLDGDEYENRIWDLLADALIISDKEKQTHLIFVREFANRIEKLVCEKVDDEIVEEEIINFIEQLAKENVPTGTNKMEQLVKSFIQKIHTLPKQEDLKDSLEIEIFNSLENLSNTNKCRRKEIIDKVADILARNINQVSDKNDNLKKELANILHNEVILAENNAKELATTLKDKINQQPSYLSVGSNLRDLNTEEYEIRKQISEEVSFILNDFNIKGKRKKNIEQNIAEVMADQIVRGVDDKKTKENIISILQGVDLSKDDADDISNRLLDKNKELSLSYRINGSKQMSSMEREGFEERAEREILIFIDDLASDNSPEAKNKRKKVTKDLVYRLGKMISNSTEINKEKRIVEEVSDYMKTISIDAGVPRDEMAKKLANCLIDKEFQTSTPKKAFKFYPERDVLEISTINFNDTQSIQQSRKPLQTNKEEENKYTDELTNIIKVWVNDLPLDLSKKENNFEQTMIQDLAEDIIDRQKYLQLNPDAKTSDQEELEHLKFQVFRWLNKLSIDDLPLIMQKTETLMKNIKDVKIPELIKPSYIDPIKNEISMWFDEISSRIFAPIDQNNKNEMFELLAEKIQHLRKNNQVDQIDGEITNWVKTILKDADKQDIAQISGTLKSRLKQKGLTEPPSFILSQGSSQFVEENLVGGIEDWLKTLPLYQKRSSTEKREVATLIPELAKALQLVLTSAQPHENSDRLCIEEIVKHLQKLPLEVSQKSDSEFLQKTASQLLNYLKGLQMFQNISDRQERPPDEYLKANLEDWMNSLPIINRLNSTQAVQFKNLRKEFEENVKQIRQEDPKNETKLKYEIQKYLQAIPIEENMKQDQTFINDKVEQLLKYLLVVPIETKHRRSFDNSIKRAADELINNIESWCDSLPINGSPEEIEKTKKQLTTKLIHKIGELNMNPEVFNDDFLYDELLEDEIDNLLSDISSEDIKKNLPTIKKGLMENVKVARLKTLEENAGQIYKKQLRDAISKTLPSLDMSDEEQASFEVVQDKLVDAFINLHYVGENDELKNKYKTKINNEIGKFCNDYLQKHPSTPIDSQKLNQDLYNALKNVPIPKEETIKNEVELAKTKDEVNDWVNEFPPKDQTPTEKIKMNKMVNVLAKKLHDIEKQKILRPDEDYDSHTKKEITKWLRKLPLHMDEATIESVTDKLMSKLKSTEKSRRVSASAKKSIDPDIFDASESGPSRQLVNRTPGIPPSSLSVEDREHLQKIRDRSSGSFRRSISKDASVNPLPIDAESQTEVRPWECCKRLDLQSSGIQTQRPPCQRTTQAVGSQSEVSPHVIVKEYYWDTTEADASKRGCFPCSPESTPKSQMPSAPCPGLSRSIPQQPSRITLSPRPPCPQATAHRPCFRPEEEPGTSRSFKRGFPKVTRLGSFDDMQPKASKSGNWSKFPEDDFWRERRTLISDDDEEPFLQERNRDEEKVRCRCRERVFTKCSARNKNKGCHTCQSKEDVKRCSKCCGIHCPYPSYLYFRQ